MKTQAENRAPIYSLLIQSAGYPPTFAQTFPME